jgi:hypothetical protein
METSPRGGRHILYRCPDAIISGAVKLAMRAVPTPENPNGVVALVETRGEGGYFCCAPSSGYVMVQGDLRAIPAIAKEEREILIRSARFLNEIRRQDEIPPTVRTAMPGSPEHYRPGDDYNGRADRGTMTELLSMHGWRRWQTHGDNTAWTRPGKDKGISATLRNIDGCEVFYVFTSSTAFAPGRAYSPFQVYAILEYGGDYTQAAADLGQQGYGGAPDDGFDALAFARRQGSRSDGKETENRESVVNPGAFPDHLLHYPGFLGDFAEYINRRAVKRQPVLSLAAAITALGTLTGRKVEGATGLRTNFYVLGVADSGDGKDMPLKIVRQLLYESGNEKLYSSDRLKSDAGIRTALEANPCTLFLLDEIGEMLDTIRYAKNSPWLKNIITEFLTLYSLAQSSGVKMGGYSDTKKNITIDCPHVCLFGTSVPESVFRAMTMDSVTGGLMGRLLIFESAFRNPQRQTPSNESIPAHLIEAAEHWRDFAPNGNLTGSHAGSSASPMRVDESVEAKRIFDKTEERAWEEMGRIPKDFHGPFKRVEENARKLAVLAACSESHVAPYIGVAAATWATELAFYLTQRLVWLASINVANNVTHEKWNRVLNAIREAGKTGISQSKLKRKFRDMTRREMLETLDSLVEAEEVEVETMKTPGRSKSIFRAT